MTKNPATYQQPPPEKDNESADVWPFVIGILAKRVTAIPPGVLEALTSDMRDRDNFGTGKYGVRLKFANGRDPAVDAYQESLDLCAYSVQALVETKDAFWAAQAGDAIGKVAGIKAWLMERERSRS